MRRPPITLTWSSAPVASSAAGAGSRDDACGSLGRSRRAGCDSAARLPKSMAAISCGAAGVAAGTAGAVPNAMSKSKAAGSSATTGSASDGLGRDGVSSRGQRGSRAAPVRRGSWARSPASGAGATASCGISGREAAASSKSKSATGSASGTSVERHGLGGARRRSGSAVSLTGSSVGSSKAAGAVGAAARRLGSSGSASASAHLGRHPPRPARRPWAATRATRRPSTRSASAGPRNMAAFQPTPVLPAMSSIQRPKPRRASADSVRSVSRRPASGRPARC